MLQQREGDLRGRVGRGQNRGGCLLQDLIPREVRRFLGEVGVRDGAVGRLDILECHAQAADRGSERVGLERTNRPLSVLTWLVASSMIFWAVARLLEVSEFAPPLDKELR